MHAYTLCCVTARQSHLKEKFNRYANSETFPSWLNYEKLEKRFQSGLQNDESTIENN
jgi:hypothetical protein